MTLSDYLSLGLSITALVFSIATFVYNTYEQYLKAAKLQLVLGSELKFGFLDGRSTLGFWVPVALANQGAVDAVVLRIEGELTRSGGAPVPVQWYTVGNYDGAKDRFVPMGWTDTLIVSSRKATTTWIGLHTTVDVARPVESGVYTLTLRVFAPVNARRRAQRVDRDGKALPATSWAGQLTLEAQTTPEVPRRAADEAGLNLSGAQLVHLTGATPQSVTALVPGLKSLVG